MGRRGYYPGTLVARVLVNRFHALRKRYFKPSNKPGRLEVVKHWFLNWEGLLLGGVFVGGLGVTAVTLYMHERVDDMRRREERCRLYGGSCMMAASHLASIQSSLALYRVLVEVSAQRAEWQQQWQQVHQARTQLAAQQVRRWQDRTAGWLGQKQLTVGGAGVQEEGEQSMQHGMAAQQQQQQQGKQQQQQQKKRQEPAEPDKQQPMHQQLQQHDQHSAPQPSGQQLPGHQQQGPLVHPLPTQPQQQQQQQQQADKQQQLPPQQAAVGWRDPVLWYFSTRSEQAVLWLQQEQAGLALSDRGVLMWQQLGRHAAQQVARLERQEQQQLLMLMAHTAQRAAWQGLKTYTSELEFWFDLPSFAGLASWLAQQVAVPHDGSSSSSSSSGSSSEESTGVGSSAAAAAALGQEGSGSACTTETAVPAAAEAGSSRRAKSVLQLLQRAASWISSGFERRQQECNAPAETAAGAAGQPQAGVGSSSSSSNSDCVGGGSMQARHWLRVRLIMPRWIPDNIEQRDWDLLCKQPQQQQQQQEEKQEGAAQDAYAETGDWVGSSSVQPGGLDPAAAADEVDSDAGGVLADVFEEALDVVEALWDAADG